MTDVVEEYWAAVEKLLACDDSMKKHLRARFDEMLASFLEEHPDPDRDELESFIGTPEDMAAELMLDVSPEDVARCRRKRRIVLAVAVAIICVIVVGVAYICSTIYSLANTEAQKTITVYEEESPEDIDELLTTIQESEGES